MHFSKLQLRQEFAWWKRRLVGCQSSSRVRCGGSGGGVVESQQELSESKHFEQGIHMQCQCWLCLKTD